MRKPQRRRAAELAILAVIATGLVGCSDDTTSGQGGETTPTITPTPTVLEGRVEPGTYRMAKDAWSSTDFSVTFGEGWTTEGGHIFNLGGFTKDGSSFHAAVVDKIYADACVGDGGEQIEVGPGVDDLVAALRRQPGSSASRPIETTLGGQPAVRIDLTVSKGFDPKDCSMGKDGVQVWVNEPAEAWLLIPPFLVASVYILDVDGQRHVFVTQHPRGQAAEDPNARELQALLDSITIES